MNQDEISHRFPVSKGPILFLQSFLRFHDTVDKM